MAPQTLVTEARELFRVHSVAAPRPLHMERVKVRGSVYWNRVPGYVELHVNVKKVAPFDLLGRKREVSPAVVHQLRC